ncbi:MAG: helix-turn-helix transcriptional regulator [Oleispira sp.]|nr:helix-turn-helix transcriptional regulator [Oleispira sp.]
MEQEKFELRDIQKGYKFIECENLEIAASCDAEFEEGEFSIGEIYHPCSVLSYMEKGTIKLTSENKTHTFTNGSFFLVRKYTHLHYIKTFTKEEKQVKSCVFFLPDHFLRKVIANITFDKNLKPTCKRIFELAPTQKLQNVVETIKQAIDYKKNIDTAQLEAKVTEALKAIVDSKPELAIIFKEFSLAKRADLHLFMNNNYMLKVPLEELAILSGRSMSTFSREFKLILGTTPHQWILKKRLQLAYKLLVETPKNISDVSLDAGFEDLAHFSKSFKKEYGQSPSEIKQKNSEKTYAQSSA